METKKMKTVELVALDSEKKRSKYYGKKKILEDIVKNGKKTELDSALLALNDLRNAYSRVKNRCINDKEKGTHYINREACREIIGSVRILENRLVRILKK